MSFEKALEAAAAREGRKSASGSLSLYYALLCLIHHITSKETFLC